MAIYKFSNVGGFGTYQRYNDFLAGNPTTPVTPPDAGAYFPLGEFTLASAQSFVEFTNIPQTYTHLQIRILGRSDKTTELNDAIALRLNNDSTSNYRSHSIQADGASVFAGSGAHTYSFLNYLAGDQGTANCFGTAIIDILDYRSTVKNKTLRGLGGNDRNGGGIMDFTSSLWFKTPEAVTSIQIYPQSFSTFKWKANSSFALYGVLA
jgi:hypothetical protein